MVPADKYKVGVIISDLESVFGQGTYEVGNAVAVFVFGQAEDEGGDKKPTARHGVAVLGGASYLFVGFE